MLTGHDPVGFPHQALRCRAGRNRLRLKRACGTAADGQSKNDGNNNQHSTQQRKRNQFFHYVSLIMAQYYYHTIVDGKTEPFAGTQTPVTGGGGLPSPIPHSRC
uniref:Uncharacterized protein n=1 Tax=Erwinia amylovora ATCC BAA-2158 TaxID=889211 RepID=E5B6Q0_ERWAM|nr:hypothetical protein predicted by Glimmer/Critica [Erwinia amylovora ATCC BAA-2158]